MFKIYYQYRTTDGKTTARVSNYTLDQFENVVDYYDFLAASLWCIAAFVTNTTTYNPKSPFLMHFEREVSA